jgi:hypothetical protein
MVSTLSPEIRSSRSFCESVSFSYHEITAFYPHTEELQNFQRNHPIYHRHPAAAGLKEISHYFQESLDIGNLSAYIGTTLIGTLWASMKYEI